MKKVLATISLSVILLLSIPAKAITAAPSFYDHYLAFVTISPQIGTLLSFSFSPLFTQTLLPSPHPLSKIPSTGYSKNEFDKLVKQRVLTAFVKSSPLTTKNTNDEIRVLSAGESNSPYTSPSLIPAELKSPEPTLVDNVKTPDDLQVPTVTPSVNKNSSESILKMINSFRSSNGLPPFRSEPYTCNFAGLRASEISSDFNHVGFSSRLDSGNLPYPSFSSVAENIAMTGDRNEVVDIWRKSGGHAENMLKNAAHACIGNSGNYYVLEIWQP